MIHGATVVALLAGSHGISVEVRDDPFDDQREVAHLPLEGLVAPVGSNGAAAEVSLINTSANSTPPDISNFTARLREVAAPGYS